MLPTGTTLSLIFPASPAVGGYRATLLWLVGTKQSPWGAISGDGFECQTLPPTVTVAVMAGSGAATLLPWRKDPDGPLQLCPSVSGSVRKLNPCSFTSGCSPLTGAGSVAPGSQRWPLLVLRYQGHLLL